MVFDGGRIDQPQARSILVYTCLGPWLTDMTIDTALPALRCICEPAFVCDRDGNQELGKQDSARMRSTR